MSTETAATLDGFCPNELVHELLADAAKHTERIFHQAASEQRELREGEKLALCRLNPGWKVDGHGFDNPVIQFGRFKHKLKLQEQYGGRTKLENAKRQLIKAQTAAAARAVEIDHEIQRLAEEKEKLNGALRLAADDVRLRELALEALQKDYTPKTELARIADLRSEVNTQLQPKLAEAKQEFEFLQWVLTTEECRLRNQDVLGEVGRMRDPRADACWRVESHETAHMQSEFDGDKYRQVPQKIYKRVFNPDAWLQLVVFATKQIGPAKAKQEKLEAELKKELARLDEELREIWG